MRYYRKTIFRKFPLPGVWKRLLLLLAVVMSLVTGCSSSRGLAHSSETKIYAYVTDDTVRIKAVQGLGIGGPAPDFRYRDSDGKLKSLSDLRGNPVLINFWTSWCPACREEMSYFEEVYRDQYWRDKGLQLLMVSLDENPSAALQFVSNSGYTFPFLLDSKQIIGDAYNIFAYPTTFFIDSKGIIKVRREGAFGDKPDLERELRKIASVAN